MSVPKYALCLDLETSGSDEYEDFILEVGAILVETRYLVPKREWSFVVRPEPLSAMWARLEANPVVLRMHGSNGLLAEVVEKGRPLAEVDTIIAAELTVEIGEGKVAVLAGSGVGHFDSRFIRRQMPQLATLLTHYAYDVGVVRRFIREVADRPELVARLPAQEGKPHRALADARLHLEEMRVYRDLLQRAAMRERDHNFQRGALIQQEAARKALAAAMEEAADAVTRRRYTLIGTPLIAVNPREFRAGGTGRGEGGQLSGSEAEKAPDVPQPPGERDPLPDQRETAAAR